MSKIETTSSVLGYTLDTYSMFSPTEYLSEDEAMEDWEIDFEAYKKDLARLAQNVIDGELSPEDPIVKSIIYTEVVDSPAYYNFKTDSGDIDLEVDIQELTKYLEKRKEEFDTYLHENFTSYDGFWSFVENNWNDFMEKYNDDEKFGDRDLHRAIAVGWYLHEEVISNDEYHEYMWEGYGEAVYNNLTDIIYTKEYLDEQNNN